MIIKILHQPDHAIAKITFKVGEQLTAQAGTMIAMSGEINTSTVVRRGQGGGILAGLQRKSTRESLFLNIFRSSINGSQVYLAPFLIGDILLYELAHYKLIIQATSYLASTSEVEIFLGLQGVKPFRSGDSLFWLNLFGKGSVLLASFGRIYEVCVDGEYLVDAGHIVAFENSLKFEMTKVDSSLLGYFLGKKRLICRFKGQGKVFCQTHHPQEFGNLIGSQLFPKPSSFRLDKGDKN